MRGKLIVFEGIDGVGKTTIAKLLKEELLKRGIPTIRYEDSERMAEGFNVIKPFIRRKAPINASLFFCVASSIYKSAEYVPQGEGEPRGENGTGARAV